MLSLKEKIQMIKKMKERKYSLITSQEIKKCKSLVYDSQTLDMYLSKEEETQKFAEKMIVDFCMGGEVEKPLSVRIIYEASVAEVPYLSPNELLECHPDKITLVYPELQYTETRISSYDEYDDIEIEHYQCHYIDFQKLISIFAENEINVKIKAEPAFDSRRAYRDQTLTTLLMYRVKKDQLPKVKNLKK